MEFSFFSIRESVRQYDGFTFNKIINRNPGYENVHASASFEAHKHVTPVLRRENLLNERYEEVLEYRALRRAHSLVGKTMR